MNAPLTGVTLELDGQLIVIPWDTSNELRLRLIEAGVGGFESRFAACGTNRPLVVEAARMQPFADVVYAWSRELEESQAIESDVWQLAGTLRAVLNG